MRQLPRRIIIATSGQSAQHVSLILAITEFFFVLCSVLIAWVLSNVSCWLSLPVHERQFTMCNSLFRLCLSPLFCKAFVPFLICLHALTWYAAL